jgi:tetratricopeptide (TPR) repeat protein
MIRSHCHAAEGTVVQALEDCSEALRWDPLLVSAYLERSAWQLRLKRHRERIEGLDQGIRQTGAGLLIGERVDALLDDSQWQRSLEAIGPELATSRLQGSWKIRRARALLGLGRRSEAERDLQEALSEIESRMPREVREPSLLMDRALAQELLGHKEAAIKDYQTAADCGGGDAAVRAVRRLQGIRPPRSFWPWRHRSDSPVSRSGG